LVANSEEICSQIKSFPGLFVIEPNPNITQFSVLECQLFLYNTDTWCRAFGKNLCTNDGWLVWLRRVDDSVDFNRHWADYKAGFGDKDGNFWLGLEELHPLTQTCDSFTFRAEMETFDGETAWAEYRTFIVADESDKYRLNLGNYNPDSTAYNSLQYSNNQGFTTLDQDNDALSKNIFLYEV